MLCRKLIHSDGNDLGITFKVHAVRLFTSHVPPKRKTPRIDKPCEDWSAAQPTDLDGLPP
ncbi:hypothetical protein FJ417_21580 [Mesorhizobium sp. B3-1-7]|nr:hypothetical protein FJ417_21580 [Mesorhizobium sp. B3-1-7]